MKNLRRDSGIKEDGDENDSNAEQPPAKKQRREDSINLEDFEVYISYVSGCYRVWKSVLII